MAGYDMAFDELTLSGPVNGSVEFLRRASQAIVVMNGTPAVAWGQSTLDAYQDISEELAANPHISVTLRESQQLSRAGWVRFFVSVRQRSSRRIWRWRLMSVFTCCSRSYIGVKQQAQEQVRAIGLRSCCL